MAFVDRRVILKKIRILQFLKISDVISLFFMIDRYYIFLNNYFLNPK